MKKRGAVIAAARRRSRRRPSRSRRRAADRWSRTSERRRSSGSRRSSRCRCASPPGSRRRRGASGAQASRPPPTSWKLRPSIRSSTAEPCRFSRLSRTWSWPPRAAPGQWPTEAKGCQPSAAGACMRLGDRIAAAVVAERAPVAENAERLRLRGGGRGASGARAAGSAPSSAAHRPPAPHWQQKSRLAPVQVASPDPRAAGPAASGEHDRQVGHKEKGSLHAYHPHRRAHRRRLCHPRFRPGRAAAARLDVGLPRRRPGRLRSAPRSTTTTTAASSTASASATISSPAAPCSASKRRRASRPTTAASAISRADDRLCVDVRTRSLYRRPRRSRRRPQRPALRHGRLYQCPLRDRL